MAGMGGRETAGFEIETTLDRKDFGIVWNRALDQGGVVLGDEVKVRIAIEAGPPQEPQA
jgi:polyisoprenoid-binding protein YceI